MKTIPKTYKRRGYGYTLIYREADVVIYQQNFIDSDKTTSYEVCIVRTRASDNEFTGTEAGDEYLPSPEEWGRYGWTYTRWEEAVNKANQLVNREREH